MTKDLTTTDDKLTKIVETNIQHKKDMEVIAEEFDFSSLKDERLALFAKYYIMTAGDRVTSVRMSLGEKQVSNSTASTMASRWLRKLRQHPDFWDILGLGYGALHEITERLKVENPAKAADIIMKVNREDTERIETDLTIDVAPELARNYRGDNNEDQSRDSQ